MIRTLLLGAFLGAAPELVRNAVRKRRRQGRRPQGYPSPGFRVGPLWARGPAEDAQTPHLPDAGGLRCLSCKTPTPNEVKTRG